MANKELSILQDGSAQCVKCATCLPHCPTYHLTQDESESPRGRISLMQALAEGDLPPENSKLQKHLRQCLTCRSCERVCPTGVPYGEMIDAAKSILGPNVSPWLNRYTLQSQWHGLIHILLWLYQRTGLRALCQHSGVLRLFKLNHLESLVPKQHRLSFWKTRYSNPATANGQHINLFLGCISNSVDRDSLRAALDCLLAWGFEVNVPKQQVCCGAIHQHGGDSAQAQSLHNTNQQAFGQIDEKIVTLATGCQLQLTETKEFNKRVIDICDLLIKTPAPENLQLRPLPKRIVVHQSCSAQQLNSPQRQTVALLKLIPEAKVEALITEGNCCGAAGTHMVTNPDKARSIADRLLENLAGDPPAFLVTRNIGCALHLTRRMHELNWPTEVVHPIRLLARQLA